MDHKIGSGARCAMIGYGSWATALAKVLTENEPSIGWYVRNPEVLESLRDKGRNPRYLSNVRFDRTRINPSDDLDRVVSEADIVILASPSAYLKKTLETLTVPLKEKFVISAIKGIVPDDYTTVVEYMHDHYDLSFKQLGIITGPSHAEEVSLERLSYLTVVCTDPENSHTIGHKFATEYIKLSYSTDLYGIEYATILKNIYAVAVGMAVGLGYGDNFLAVLISNSAMEMARFLRESYPDQRETRASAYLGDLLVTCYSVYTRNRKLGLLIGHGCTVRDALDEMTQVAEGYFAADCIRHINARHKIEMPIAEMVYNVLYQGASARKCMKELTTKRATAAMPIAGGYRSIDFALSNMANSHINKVGVFTQYNSKSLAQHLNSSKWWDFGRKQEDCLYLHHLSHQTMDSGIEELQMPLHRILIF